MTTGSALRWRVARVRREAERRRLETRHALLVARHRRRLRRARWLSAGFGAATVVSVVGTLDTGGVVEMSWAVAAVGCALEAGAWGRAMVLRSRAEPPAAPALPHAVPSPPPRGSAAWPALRRLEAALTALRRLTPALPAGLAEAAEPSVAAARAAYEVGRAQAAQIAATETALAIISAADRPGLEQVRSQLLAELDLAAAAVEHLLTSATGLIGTASGYDAQSRLSAATAEVVARTYGLRAAALIPGDQP